MWFWWAFGSALFNAFSMVIAKKALNNKVRASVLSLAMFGLSLPMVGLVCLMRQPTELNNWFWIGSAGSAGVFGLAFTLRMLSTKSSNLSKLSPLLTLNVLFAYLLALIFLKEAVSMIAGAGLALIITGLYLLNIPKTVKDWLKPIKALVTDRMTLLFVIGMFFTSVSAIFDKIAVTNTRPSNPPLTLLTINSITTVMVLIYVLGRKGGWFEEIKQNFKSLFVASNLYGLSSMMIYFGFASGPVALNVAIKQSQVLFVLILSWWWFKDKPTKYIVIGSLLMILGAILIKGF